MHHNYSICSNTQGKSSLHLTDIDSATDLANSPRYPVIIGVLLQDC